MNNIKELIYTIRGVKVMLDSDLAQLYDYTTKAFNQQVKNNIEKFDSDFRFQLTKEEYHEILRSKNLTSNTETNSSLSTDLTNSTKLRSNFLTLELENDFLRSKNLTSKDKRGGRQYLPFVFTEQGIYMQNLKSNFMKIILKKSRLNQTLLLDFCLSLQYQFNL